MTNSIKESTLYLFADSISDPEVVANPKAAKHRTATHRKAA